MNKELITSIFAPLILGLFVFITSSCEKETAIEEDNPGSDIVADKTDVAPYEIIKLTSSDFIFTADYYDAFISDYEIQLLRVDDQTLTFMMPNVPTGEQMLLLDLSGNSFEIVFNINALTEINNPDTYFNEYKTDLRNMLDTLMQLDNQQFNAVSTNMDLAEAYMSDFESAYQSATNEQRIEFVQMMEANPEIFDFTIDLHDFNDSLFTGTKDFVKWDKQLESDSRYFVGLVIATAATIGIFDGVLLTGNPIAIGITGAAIVVEFTLILDQADKILTSSYAPFQFAVDNELKNNLTFDCDVSNLNVNAQYRTLYSGDLGGSSTISSLASSLQTFAGYWDKVVNAIPGLDGDVKTLDEQTNYTEGGTSAVSAEYLSIENISNSQVSMESFSNENEQLNVLFSNSEPVDQSFTFDLQYANPNFNSVTETVSASIIPTDVYYFDIANTASSDTCNTITFYFNNDSYVLEPGESQQVLLEFGVSYTFTWSPAIEPYSTEIFNNCESGGGGSASVGNCSSKGSYEINIPNL